MELSERKCVACRGDTPALSADQAIRYLTEAPGWVIVSKALERTIRFDNFKLALGFFNRVAQIAEEEDHHPDMCIKKWREVTLSFTTHAAGGLTENDFIMAAKINALG